MKEFVCTGCSLLCDDVAYEQSGGEVKSLGLCRLGHNFLEAAFKQIEDVKTATGDVISKAAELLSSAQHPLCYGWTSSTNETIREGLALTKTLNGFFDTPTSLGLSKALGHSLHSKGLEIDLGEGTVTSLGPIVDLPAAVGTGSGGGFSWGYLDPAFGIFQRITALEKEEKLEIVSSPRVMTVPGEMAFT